MDNFVSCIHLLVGFFLLGALINIGEDVAHVLGIAMNFLGFSITASDISGSVPFVALQAYAARTGVKLPATGVVGDVSTVAVYKAPPRVRITSGSTTALINYLAVMALVNTAVGVESVVQADLEPASVPLPVMAIQVLDMVVDLAPVEGYLVATRMHRASSVRLPLLYAPRVNIVRDLLNMRSAKLEAVPSPVADTALVKASVTQKPVSRRGRLPFDVSALFRGQPLPAFSAEDLTSWDNTRHTNQVETLASRTQIKVEDLAAPGLYARSVPASGLFPSASDAHIGLHTPCELPPLPRTVATVADAPVPEVVHVRVAPDQEAPAISAQLKWTAESGVSLMDALGVSAATTTKASTATEAHSIASVDFRWNVTSGVPLMKALGFASVPFGETTAVNGRQGNFKWNSASGVSLMEALGAGGQKLGTVHAI